MGTFMNLPVSYREKCYKFVASCGYEFGDPCYKEVRPRRRKDAKDIEQKGDLAKLFDLPVNHIDVPSVVSDFYTRMEWNLYIWKKVIDRMPQYPRKIMEDMDWEEQIHKNKTLVYIGCSGSSHITTFEKVDGIFNLLTSFAYLGNKKFLKRFTGYGQ